MVDERIGSIEKRLEEVEERQGKSRRRVEDLRTEVRGVYSKMKVIEGNQNSSEERVKDLSESVSNVNNKLEEEFKKMMSKNDKILDHILEGQLREEERTHELKMLKRTEIYKIVGLVVGSGGIIYTLIQTLI